MEPRNHQEAATVRRNLVQLRGPPRRWVWFLAGAATSALCIKLYDDNSRLGLSWRITKRVLLGPSEPSERRWWQWKSRKVDSSRDEENLDGSSPRSVGLENDPKGGDTGVGRQASEKFANVSEETKRRVTSGVSLLRAKLQKKSEKGGESARSQEDS